MKLALVDRDPEPLAVAKSTLENTAGAETYIADVADLERWKKLRIQIGQRFGAVNMLVLNAGMTAKGDWDDVDHLRKVCQEPCPARSPLNPLMNANFPLSALSAQPI